MFHNKAHATTICLTALMCGAAKSVQVAIVLHYKITRAAGLFSHITPSMPSQISAGAVVLCSFTGGLEHELAGFPSHYSFCRG